MPTIPEPFVRQDYRGLNDAEDGLLRTYLRQREGDVTGLQTAVHLGPGEDVGEAQPDAFRRSWRESSKLKADAIVERPGVIEVVELKDFLRTSALGQALSYRYWYTAERQPTKPVQMWVTAPDVNPSVVQPLAFHDVHVHVQTAEGQRHLQQGQTANPPF